LIGTVLVLALFYEKASSDTEIFLRGMFLQQQKRGTSPTYQPEYVHRMKQWCPVALLVFTNKHLCHSNSTLKGL